MKNESELENRICRQIQDLHASFSVWKKGRTPEAKAPRNSMIIKISLFGHETWHSNTVPDIAYGPSCYRMGSKLSLILLYMQLFLRYGRFIKINLFGHEIWNLKTGPKVAYVLSFYPQWGPKLSLLRHGLPFTRYGLISNFHIWAWNLEFAESSQSCICTLFLTQWAKLLI